MTEVSFTGWLATDSDGYQFVYKDFPMRINHKKHKDERPTPTKRGEWRQGSWLFPESKLSKFLLGKRLFKNHKWKDNPVKIQLDIKILEE